MKFIILVTVGLMELLNSCQHASQTTASETKDDSLPWVQYRVHDLANDTTLFAQPQQVGVLTDSDLLETSGLVASRRNPGYLWAEEDSGNPNEIQLLNQSGKVVARFIVDGAINRDWEDIAIGAGPVAGQTYLYLADIGDNKHQYSEKVIYRFPEPTVVGQRLPYEGHITNAEIIRLQLPDGSQNAEAILVDSATKDLFILSKGERSLVYRAAYPQSLTQTTTMSRVLAMPFKDVTSAALSPDGSEILIRTYEKLFYYRRRSVESILDALKRVPLQLPLATELQGEAVGWASNGAGYYTTTEELDGEPQIIYYYARKK
ncbi:hypothetical protein G8759_07515 [Spirosoma aureum]|uniref:PE-PGRS family protein n=2 Tax=Spirosoma aureum TaxID=2692134 RepID=A0A6G9AJ37_9BACT|nr:hypothetical protein G8759_07515 [Spirosoma aureum]